MSVSAQIRIRRDTAANFTSANPTLALGEIAFETDTRNFKVGDGTTAWTSLPYATNYRGNAVADTTNVAIGSGAAAGAQAGTNETTAVGAGALAVNTYNGSTAVGFEALNKNTTGQNNTAVGQRALRNVVTGLGNTAMGLQAGRDLTSSNNTLIGNFAGLRITTGASNTGVGSQVLFTNETGANNTAIGHQALLLNTASDITAVGAYALDANTTGTQNTAVGRSALGANTTGQFNTAVGHGSLLFNTTGAYNAAFGVGALTQNIGGDYHTAIGRAAMNAVTGGTQSTALGNSALVHETTGDKNTGLGASAGAFYGTNTPVTAASNSVFVGFGTKPAGDSQTNQIVIGADAVGNGSNTTTIGNSSTTSTVIPAGQLVVGTTTLPAADVRGMFSRNTDCKVSAQCTGTGAGANAGFFADAGTEGSWGIQTGNATSGGLRFYDLKANADRGRWDASGNLSIANGNLILANGKGIDFSATANSGGTMSSELLSDYEEGTFTPTYNSGVTSPTYGSSRDGWYCKIGNMVYFSARVDLTAGTAAASVLRIAGLPFTSSATNLRVGGGYVVYSSGLVANNTDALPTFYVDYGATTGSFYQNDGTAFNGTEANSITGPVIVNGSYPTF